MSGVRQDSSPTGAPPISSPRSSPRPQSARMALASRSLPRSIRFDETVITNETVFSVRRPVGTKHSTWPLPRGPKGTRKVQEGRRAGQLKHPISNTLFELSKQSVALDTSGLNGATLQTDGALIATPGFVNWPHGTQANGPKSYPDFLQNSSKITSGASSPTQSRAHRKVEAARTSNTVTPAMFVPNVVASTIKLAASDRPLNQRASEVRCLIQISTFDSQMPQVKSIQRAISSIATKEQQLHEHRKSLHTTMKGISAIEQYLHEQMCVPPCASASRAKRYRSHWG